MLLNLFSEVNDQLGALLNEVGDNLFMSWRRSSIKEVNDLAPLKLCKQTFFEFFQLFSLIIQHDQCFYTTIFGLFAHIFHSSSWLQRLVRNLKYLEFIILGKVSLLDNAPNYVLSKRDDQPSCICMQIPRARNLENVAVVNTEWMIFYCVSIWNFLE